MGRLACSLDLGTCRSSASRLVLYTLSLSERYWISHPNAKVVETPTGWKKTAVVRLPKTDEALASPSQ